MDPFSIKRLQNIVDQYHKKTGHDISGGELESEGFSASDLRFAVDHGHLTKYQVTNRKGTVENRYKVHKDWRSLNR